MIEMSTIAWLQMHIEKLIAMNQLYLISNSNTTSVLILVRQNIFAVKWAAGLILFSRQIKMLRQVIVIYKYILPNRLIILNVL